MHSHPLVSFLLITYNHEQFISDALESAFLQKYSPLEIIVSDDCSTDNTYKIIDDIASSYKGSHKIILNRNPENLGLAGNLNRAWELCNGDFIVAAGGDDISLPDRTGKLVERWQDKSSPVDLVVSYFEEIDVNGNSTGFVKKEVTFTPDLSKKVFEWRCGATGACAGYSRKLYEKYGPLDTHVISEDWVYSFRAWLELGIGLIKEPLVKHRTHDNGIGVLTRNVNTLKDVKQRVLRRRKMVEDALARSREWLKAWRISKKEENLWIDTELQRLVRLNEIHLRAFDSGRLTALMLVLAFLKEGGSVSKASKLLMRQVIKWEW